MNLVIPRTSISIFDHQGNFGCLKVTFLLFYYEVSCLVYYWRNEDSVNHLLTIPFVHLRSFLPPILPVHHRLVESSDTIVYGHADYDVPMSLLFYFVKKLSSWKSDS